jgi:tRNA(adenine34) deaminase
MSFFQDDQRWMKQAMREAERAYDAGEVPIGAIVVRRGEVVGRGHNQVERLKDPTAHAEMIALTAACETIGDKFLGDCTLYVTLEPCPMCAGATVLARLKRLVFAAFDEKAGAASTLYNIPRDGRLNHRVDIVSGIMDEESVALLRQFFAEKRARGTA